MHNDYFLEKMLEFQKRELEKINRESWRFNTQEEQIKEEIKEEIDETECCCC